MPKSSRRTVFLLMFVMVCTLGWLADYGAVLRHQQEETTLFKEKLSVVQSFISKRPVNDVEVVESAVDNIGNNNNKAINEAPLLILHVGPRKTGTSTIQKFSVNHHKQLEKENVYYLGHYGRHYETNLHFLSLYCLSCKSNKDDDCGCSKRWKDLGDVVDSHFKMGHNVLMSDETLNRFFVADQHDFLWRQLEPILNQGWRIRIVFTYRRYYSFLPSSYVQNFHPGGSDGKEKRQSWPDKGGRIIPPFTDYVEKFTTRTSKQMDYVKKQWDNKFPAQVKVFNLHDQGDYITNFFCQMVPEAEHLCHRLKTDQVNNSTKGTMNSSSNKEALHFDMLATTAYQQGLVDASLTRPFVSNKTEEYAMELGMKSLLDFPLTCPDEKLTNKLLNLTLALEMEMVPDFYESPLGAREIECNLMNASKTGTFCSIDANATLRDPKWRQFFKDLSPP